jgi:hypothetical protein
LAATRNFVVRKGFTVKFARRQKPAPRGLLNF